MIRATNGQPHSSGEAMMTKKFPTELDEALDGKTVRRILRISKATQARWHDKYGLPRPAYFVGRRGFTWRSQLMAWIEARDKKSSMAGHVIPGSPNQR